MNQLQATRRGFLKSAAVATAALAVPYYVPARAFGANDRVVTGHIGLGGQGRSNLNRLKSHAAALCDVDEKHLARAMGMVGGDQQVDGYTDFRQILDRKDIDAVVISTPDHWHAIPTIMACQAGKDVYCEKPLTLTIAEGRQMVKAAREHGRIVQTGSQQRSAGNFRYACELVRSGKIGKVTEVLVGIPGPNHPGKPVPDTDPPEELHYQFWLGPAPERPYNPKRVHYNFRFFKDYSGGQATNWGAHHLDIAQWGLGMDNSGPISAEAVEAQYHPEGWHEVTEKCRVVFEYANGVKLTLGQGQKDIPTGTTFIGTEGKIYVNRGQLKSDPGEITKIKLGDDDVQLYDSKNHHGNWLDCIKSRELPICDVEVGHRSATVCHLVNLACELGRKLTWDPELEAFTNDDEANAQVLRPHRDAWKTA